MSVAITIQEDPNFLVAENSAVISVPAKIIPVLWQDVAARRRAEIYAAITQDYLLPKAKLLPENLSNLALTCGLLNFKEKIIIKSSATHLLSQIHSGVYTSVEVTNAFCKSAAIAHQATNCLALTMFDEALKDAADLDEYLRVHGKPKGPLHGLPISVKEHIELAGTPATSGFIKWADNVSCADSLIIQLLRAAGAVFHVKTTNPQSLMAIETASNLYGVTTNPYNSRLTSGGSSGGEGALIAMGGSLLGIGTDIGGSIRAPSAFCGIFGLKPSVARLPHGGLSGAHGGMENIIGVVGPMATNVDDLRLFCKVVLDAQPWLLEPPLIELPWKDTKQLSRPLRIGVIRHDGIVQPHPPVSRCLQETEDKLKAAGHTIIPWNPKLHRDLVACIDKMYFLDGGKEYYDILDAGNEPPVEIIDWILKRADPTICTAAETWKVNRLRNSLQLAYASQWNAADIDVLLCPSNPAAASAHNESKYWGYTSVFNILDYSAAVFPVGSVKESDTWENIPRASTTTLGPEDASFESLYEGPEKYKNAPVALQLVTRRLNEEKLLVMLEEILKAIQS